MGQKAYFGLSWVLSLILAILPPTNIILGIVVRFQREKYLMAVLNFFLFPVFYFIDLISLIVNKDLEWLA